MTEDRKLSVLRAIVEDYVRTREPVGSKTLVERHRLGVSPATIRGDMAVLEEEGYITQPHTSAGRIPTDKGYRLFVDRISAVKPLSAAERRGVQLLLEGAHDLDDVVERTVRALAQLTRQVAVVQYPSLRRATVRHLELVPVGIGQVLVVLITDSGRVEQRIVELPRTAPATGGRTREAVLGELRARLNAAVDGQPVTQLRVTAERLPETFAPEERDAVRAVVTGLDDLLLAEREERIVLAGTANLARSVTDFPRTLGPVLEAIEEQVVLLRLLSEMADDASGVSVRIGSENVHHGLGDASVVASGYGGALGVGGPGAGTDMVAQLAVLGPTRMDYPTTMAAVRAVARYVTRILADGERGDGSST